MQKSFVILVIIAVVVVLALICAIFITAYASETNETEYTIYIPYIHANPWGDAVCRIDYWHTPFPEECYPWPWIEEGE